MILQNCTEVNPDILGIELISDALLLYQIPLPLVESSASLMSIAVIVTSQCHWVKNKKLTRVPFGEWCVKIEHLLQGEDSLKDERVIDKHALLLPFWHRTVVC